MVRPVARRRDDVESNLAGPQPPAIGEFPGRPRERCHPTRADEDRRAGPGGQLLRAARVPWIDVRERDRHDATAAGCDGCLDRVEERFSRIARVHDHHLRTANEHGIDRSTGRSEPGGAGHHGQARVQPFEPAGRFRGHAELPTNLLERDGPLQTLERGRGRWPELDFAACHGDESRPRCRPAVVGHLVRVDGQRGVGRQFRDEEARVEAARVRPGRDPVGDLDQVVRL